MIVSKEIQKRYANALRKNDITAFIKVFEETQQQFIPMFLVGHGLLSSEALSVVTEEFIEQTIKFWDLNFISKKQTLFSWLYLKRFSQARNFAVWLFKYGAEKMPTSDHLLLLSPLEKDKLSTTYPFMKFLNLIPKKSVELSGKNYFLWLIKYGTLDQVKTNYYPGAEFLEDEDGTKLLCYLTNSKSEIREWMFSNTKIAEDPLFKKLGIKIYSTSFLPRPWKKPMFELEGKTLKEALGVRSKLIIKTLQDKSKFPFGAGCFEVCLDYFNAVFLIKKAIPDLDENVLNNALNKVLVQKWNLNIDDLPAIIKIVWKNFSNYSVERRLRLILTANISLSNIKDIERMLETKASAARELNIKLLPVKPPALYYIHNHLTKIPELLAENKLLQPVYFKELNGSSFDNLTICYPKDELDLVKIGIELSICVGSEYYRSRAIKGECDIFTITEHNKMIACVEIINRAGLIVVEQVSGLENKPVPERINKFITEVFKQQIPDKYVSFYFPSEFEENY